MESVLVVYSHANLWTQLGKKHDQSVSSFPRVPKNKQDAFANVQPKLSARYEQEKFQLTNKLLSFREQADKTLNLVKSLGPVLAFHMVIVLSKRKISPRGEVYSLYGLYRYVRPQSVWFFSRFDHKKDTDLSHFGDKWGMNWIRFLEKATFS